MAKSSTIGYQDHLCGKAKAWQNVRLHATQKRLAAVLACNTKNYRVVLRVKGEIQAFSHTAPQAEHLGARLREL